MTHRNNPERWIKVDVWTWLDSIPSFVEQRAAGERTDVMRTSHRTVWMIWLCCLTIGLSVSLQAVPKAHAQDATSEPEAANARNPLAVRQQIVRDRVTQLEDRMFRLAEKLATAEPQQAKRLEQALRQSREMLIRRNMDETIALLQQLELATATDRQASIKQSLEQVLKILLAEPDRSQELQEQISRLKAFQTQVETLLKEQRRLEAKAEAAQQQRQLQKQAARLANDMRGGLQGQEGQSTSQEEASPKNKNQQSEGQPGEDQPAGDASKSQQSQQANAPGTQNVQKSSEHMNDAGNNLERQATGQAGADQRKAIDELEQARQALEQALQQLQQEKQQDTLHRLEARFRDMLDRQLAINKNTETLAAKNAATWTRSDELTLAGLVRDETTLANDAAKSRRIVIEDGTSVIFPKIIKQLEEDMFEVVQLLRQRETNAVTQQHEAEIAATLSALIEALKETNPPSGSGRGGSGEGGSGGGTPPLLPKSAELKMLRSCQERVNRQTKTFHTARERLTDRLSAKPSADEQQQLERIAERQQNVAEMTRTLNESLARHPLQGDDQ